MYREIARNRRPDGRYQPWYAHNQAHVRRRRPKPRRLAVDTALREAVAGKLRRRWSPAQISRWLRRRYPRRIAWQVCAETIYEAGGPRVVMVNTPWWSAVTRTRPPLSRMFSRVPGTQPRALMTVASATRPLQSIAAVP